MLPDFFTDLARILPESFQTGRGGGGGGCRATKRVHKMTLTIHALYEIKWLQKMTNMIFTFIIILIIIAYSLRYLILRIMRVGTREGNKGR